VRKNVGVRMTKPVLGALAGWALLWLGVLAAAMIWQSDRPVDIAQIVGALFSIASMVAIGCASLWRMATARRHSHEGLIDRLAVGAHKGRLPLLGSVDLTILGVRTPRNWSRISRAQLPYAKRAKLDPSLESAFQHNNFVIVHGPSASGKSRSTSEVARDLYRTSPVLVPARRPGALAQLLDGDAVPDTSVVWLDNFEQHLTAGVSFDVVQRLLARPGITVLATIRDTALEQLKPRGNLTSPGSEVFGLAYFVKFAGWDPADRLTASQSLSDEPDIIHALSQGMGLSEFLSAGPDLLDKMLLGDPPAEGVAVSRAVIDWFRSGMNIPMPEQHASTFFRHYLPADDFSLAERFRQGLEWATDPVSGVRLITRRTDGDGLTVHDYVLDAFAGDLGAAPPPEFWAEMQEVLADDPQGLTIVGMNVYRSYRDLRTAETFLRRAVTAGYLPAMASLGLILEESEERAEAEEWYLLGRRGRRCRRYEEPRRPTARPPGPDRGRTVVPRGRRGRRCRRYEEPRRPTARPPEPDRGRTMVPQGRRGRRCHRHERSFAASGGTRTTY
jgi:hypothetical protein